MHAWRRDHRGDIGGAESEKPGVLVHGTVNGYKHLGCRCAECTEAKRVDNMAWRHRNPEKHRAQMTAYRARNADKMAEYRRRWKMANPHIVNGTDPRRAAAKFDAEAIAYAEMIRRDPCVYCGRPATEIDHIHPVSLSESSHWTNLAPICDRCNSSKGAKSVLRYLLYRAA